MVVELVAPAWGGLGDTEPLNEEFIVVIILLLGQQDKIQIV